jgi:hypothetical protein
MLPALMGLGEVPSGKTTVTKFMTVAWYLAGALVAVTAYQFFTVKSNQ